MTSSVHITGSLTFSSAKRLQEALEGYERLHWVEFAPTSAWQVNKTVASIDLKTECPADGIDNFDASFIKVAHGAKHGHLCLHWSYEQPASEIKAPGWKIQHEPPRYEQLALSQYIYPKERVLTARRAPAAPVDEALDPGRLYVALRRKGYAMAHMMQLGAIQQMVPDPQGQRVAVIPSARINKLVAGTDTAHGLVLLDAQTGQELDRLFPGSLHTDAVAWSPEGRFLAAACYSNHNRQKKTWAGSTLYVWDLEKDARRHKMPLKAKDVLAQKLTWSEDGGTLSSKNQGSWEMKL